MSVETLLASEMEAGLAIGLEKSVMQEISERRRPYIVRLGEEALNGQVLMPARMPNGDTEYFEAARSISRLGDWMDKGGTRLTLGDFEGALQVLSQDMLSKLHQTGTRDFYGNIPNGGKLLIKADPNRGLDEKVAIMRAAAEWMDRSGIAGHDKSVPAGDIGMNSSAIMNGFAEVIRDRGHSDWQGSITGKSPEMGGLEFRPDATGHGVYMSMKHMSEKLGLDGPVQVTISGAGNVGGFTGLYASRDGDFSIRGISDAGGTLYVENADPTAGIFVDESLLDIMDNANFEHDERYIEYRGNKFGKLAAMAEVLGNNQPDLKVSINKDPRYIMSVPSDIFVPASVRELVNDETADWLGKAGVKVLIEAGNDSITTRGYDGLAQNGVVVIPGTIANAGGVAVSMVEQLANIRGEKLSLDSTKELAVRSALQRHKRLDDMAEYMGTKDMRQAASALGMASMALTIGYYDLDSGIRKIINPDLPLAA